MLIFGIIYNILFCMYLVGTSIGIDIVSQIGLYGSFACHIFAITWACSLMSTISNVYKRYGLPNKGKTGVIIVVAGVIPFILFMIGSIITFYMFMNTVTYAISDSYIEQILQIANVLIVLICVMAIAMATCCVVGYSNMQKQINTCVDTLEANNIYVREEEVFTPGGGNMDGMSQQTQYNKMGQNNFGNQQPNSVNQPSVNNQNNNPYGN